MGGEDGLLGWTGGAGIGDGDTVVEYLGLYGGDGRAEAEDENGETLRHVKVSYLKRMKIRM